MNRILIDAIMTAYGMTKREAEKFARRIDEDMKQELIKGFMQDARKAAYNDWGGITIWNIPKQNEKKTEIYHLSR